MKKLSLLFLSALLVFTACDNDDNADMLTEADVARIVASALADANIPSTSEISSAVTAAVTAAMASGTDIDQAIADALAAQNAAPAEIVHSGLITSNETWLNSSIHILDGRVIVAEGINLTIQEGTVIKGRAKADPTQASALLVARGAKLFAVGTAELPIIMTAESDLIQRDHTYAAGSPNLGSDDHALWGGLIVCGYAKISDALNSGENNIEGIPTNVSYGRYGGTNDDDNSGVMQYISLRHGGTSIGADNEINGITLGGVGNNTVFQNIEIYANKDDGVEFFGGSVDLTNVVVVHQGDDGIDTDEAYSGTVSNVVIIGNPNASAADTGGSGMELSGRLGTYEASNPSQMVNVSINTGQLRGAMYLKDDLYSNLTNFYVTGYSDTQAIAATAPWSHAERSLMGVASDARINAGDGGDANGVTFSDWEFKNASGVTATLNDIFSDASYGGYTIADFATLVTTKSAGQGADTSVFGWTRAHDEGFLTF